MSAGGDKEEGSSKQVMGEKWVLFQHCALLGAAQRFRGHCGAGTWSVKLCVVPERRRTTWVKSAIVSSRELELKKALTVYARLLVGFYKSCAGWCGDGRDRGGNVPNEGYLQNCS